MTNLRRVDPGEPITADWANALVDAIAALSRIVGVPPVQVQTGPGGTQIALPPLARFDLVELNDTIGPGDTDMQAERFAFDPASSDKWIDTHQTLEHTADPQRGLYLAGERHLTFFHPAAGQRIPIPGVQFHLGKLNGALAAGGSASVEVYKIASGSPADSTHSVTAHDWLLPAGASLVAGTPVYVLFHNQSKRFYALPLYEHSAVYMTATLAASGTDFGSVIASLTSIEAQGVTISGGNSIDVPEDGVYSIRCSATISADWSHATWTLGSPINDRLPCSVLIYGQQALGAIAYITSPTRGFGDVMIPAQLTVVVNAALSAGATIAISIGVNPEGPAATNITWSVAGMATIERIGPMP